MHIEIRSLFKTYRPNTVALSDVNLGIGAGMFGLLGPNGAGKTTLMRILATLIDPTSGAVSVDGIDVQHNKEAIRRQLGYLPQSFGLYPRLNPVETLDYIGTLKGMPDPRERRRRIHEILETVNLWEHRRRKVREFSGGMLQRLGIAQALLGDPRLLIVDEPTAGLDPEERIRFRNLLAMMSGERVVLLSTHIVADVESSCSDMAVIRKGRVIFRGAPEDLVRAADGKVWQVRCSRSMFERLRDAGERTITVIGAKDSGDMVEVRVVCAGRPALGESASVSAAPDATLEDAYIALMEAV
ncbi:MAG: ABC transporter ATP-binding protein [Bacillota bacterium]